MPHAIPFAAAYAASNTAAHPPPHAIEPISGSGEFISLSERKGRRGIRAISRSQAPVLDMRGRPGTVLGDTLAAPVKHRMAQASRAWRCLCAAFAGVAM